MPIFEKAFAGFEEQEKREIREKREPHCFDGVISHGQKGTFLNNSAQAL
jgi:hypothetical protein